MSGRFFISDGHTLFKAAVTGILRIAKESIFSGLNNLDVCTMLRKDFSTRFGFTQDEIDKTLTDFDLTHLSDEIKEWYNGYDMAGTTIYNPWSVISRINRPEEIIKIAIAIKGKMVQCVIQKP